jgi:hypothetical protein
MRTIAFVSAIGCALLVTSCSKTGPVQPSETPSVPMMFESGRVVVYVYWDKQGVPDKTVELVGLHQVRKTNEAGIAEFVAPVGTHIVRVYDINRGGPPLRFIDTEITVTPGQEVRVEVFDCLPCV